MSDQTEARSGPRSRADWVPVPEQRVALGSHVVTPRRGYLHHGIYVGDGNVVHYAGLAHGLQRGPVEEISFALFSRGRPVWMRSNEPSSFAPQEVIRRARSRVGEDCYRLLTNNCEHFCEWCLRGEPRSYQVEAWRARRPGRALAAFVIFLLGFGALVSSIGWAQTTAAAAIQNDSAQCIACHGMHGEGGAAGAPRLAGQNAAYMSHALSMFKSATRANAIMQPIAQRLSDPQINELADFFSRQNGPSIDAKVAVSPQLLLAGKQLAEVGAGNVAACFSCHAGQGRGNGARYPSIAGQPTRFVIDRLHEFQARAREKVPQPGTMTAVAATLDESQIEASAAYLSHLEQ
jgi:cytochrome c553